MDVIDYEIEEVKKIAEQVINNSKVVTCVRSLVRINIRQTESRQVTVCIRFPSNYPHEHLLLELKSLTIHSKFLEGLTLVAEQKIANNFLGKPQALHVLKFIDSYLRENPLCIAYNEISTIKALLKDKKKLGVGDGELKCLQKSSTLSMTVNGGCYFYKAKFIVPEEYPTKCVCLSEHKTNFPHTLVRFLNGQAKEIARKCVEAPLNRGDISKFEVRASILPALTFLIEAVVDFNNEMCPICEEKCLPIDPSEVELNDTADRYIERVFCGHIYHLGCLRNYMRLPPFPSNGKTCPAKTAHPRSDHKAQPSKSRKSNQLNLENTCGVRISHDRWGLSVKLAEARWAREQARERELEEVKDFLQ